MTILIGLHGKKKAGKSTFENTARKTDMGGSVLFIAFADALKEVCRMLAWKNKNSFDTQEGKSTVLSNVTLNLTEVCFDIVSFGFRYNNCIDLDLNPIECMQKLQEEIRKTFEVRDMQSQNYQYLDFNRMTAGRLLQVMGTDICRNTIHPDIWVKIVQNKILYNQGKKDFIMVTDVRCQNEYEMLLNLDMEKHVLRIQRNNQPNEAAVVNSGYLKDRVGNHSSEVELDEFHMHTLVNDGTLEDFEEKVVDILEDVSVISTLPIL